MMSIDDVREALKSASSDGEPIEGKEAKALLESLDGFLGYVRRLHEALRATGDELVCCSEHDCGCLGSTKAEYRESLTLTATGGQ